jgi:hypothetical protein
MTTIVIATAKALLKVAQISARRIEASFSPRPTLVQVGVAPSVATSAVTRRRTALRHHKVMMIAAALHANCPRGWLDYTLVWAGDARGLSRGCRIIHVKAFPTRASPA